MGRTVSQRGLARPTPGEQVLAASLTAPECELLPVLGGLVSDCVGDIGLAVWIALGRAHQGGVSNLAGQWRDCGRPVPGYLADALDRLTNAGQLALADPDPQSCGARPVTVTDTGYAQYVKLCQVHGPQGRASVSTPHRWARSPHDQRSHLLAQRGPDQIGIQVAVCSHRMPWSVDTSTQPTERNCLTCEALATGPVPAPQRHNPPDAGRPPAETAPGGRPDTKTPAGRRLSSPAPLPAPGGQPDPSHQAGKSSVGQRIRPHLARVLEGC